MLGFKETLGEGGCTTPRSHHPSKMAYSGPFNLSAELFGKLESEDGYILPAFKEPEKFGVKTLPENEVFILKSYSEKESQFIREKGKESDIYVACNLINEEGEEIFFTGGGDFCKKLLSAPPNLDEGGSVYLLMKKPCEKNYHKFSMIAMPIEDFKSICVDEEGEQFTDSSSDSLISPTQKHNPVKCSKSGERVCIYR